MSSQESGSEYSPSPDQEPTTNLDPIEYAFSQVDGFNRQNHPGSVLGRMLINRMRFEPVNEPEPSDLMQQEERIEIPDEIGQAGRLLGEIGIGIEVVRGKGATISGQGEEMPIKAMRFNIIDGGEFVTFLSELQPDTISERLISDNLEVVAKSVIRQMEDNYQPGEEGFMQFLATSRQMEDHYRRLGLDDVADKIHIYVEHAESRDLLEFILVSNSGLLQKPGEGFGPGDWQKDASKQTMQEMWDHAFAILESSKQNPNADALYQQTLEHLQVCARASLDDIPNLLDTYPVDYVEGIQPIIEEANGKLMLYDMDFDLDGIDFGDDESNS